MSVPDEAPGLAGGAGAIARQADIESGRAEFAVRCFAGRAFDAEAGPGGAGGGLVKAYEHAAALIFFGEQDKAARRGQTHRFRRWCDRAKRDRARQVQGLLCGPERVGLVRCAHEQDPLKRNAELRQTLGIKAAMLGFQMLREGPEDEALGLRQSPGQRETETCRRVAGAGRANLR